MVRFSLYRMYFVVVVFFVFFKTIFMIIFFLFVFCIGITLPTVQEDASEGIMFNDCILL